MIATLAKSWGPARAIVNRRGTLAPIPAPPARTPLLIISPLCDVFRLRLIAHTKGGFREATASGCVVNGVRLRYRGHTAGHPPSNHSNNDSEAMATTPHAIADECTTRRQEAHTRVPALVSHKRNQANDPKSCHATTLSLDAAI